MIPSGAGLTSNSKAVATGPEVDHMFVTWSPDTVHKATLH